MTPEQEEHLTHINDEAQGRIDYKYRRGAAEHGGNLWELTFGQILDQAIDEAVDQVIYLLTLRDKMKKG